MMGSRRYIVSFALALLLIPGEAEGQLGFLDGPTLAVGPEISYSPDRRMGLGGRARWTLPNGVNLVGQGIFFFPGAEGVAEPDAKAKQRWWQANLNATSAPDAWGGWIYFGAGAVYTRRTLELEHNGFSVASTGSRWFMNILVGAQIPGASRTPFVEAKRELRDGRWVFTTGLTFGVF